MVEKFIFLEHTADIKIKVFGKSLSKIFENAALALSSYISEDKKLTSKIKKRITIQADNKESMLYSFLDELIYLLDAENFLVAKADVKINKTKLTARLFGVSTNKKCLNHVKAATYAEMYIKKLKAGWEAQFVLDV